ncbi:unnamed protein product [Hydatigera taeniaeformis]|uniref:GNAT family N-acetyltransferase n=1 Tax=Hydatigena taeniaeformis TaxID=6205 RepID=A0A0R3WSU1_HYDTA|nr:unnamed protein product [Hydatigera taeniaeformis]
MGIVVDLSDEVRATAPIYEGLYNYVFTSDTECEVLRGIKEQHCFMTLGFASELTTASNCHSLERI